MRRTPSFAPAEKPEAGEEASSMGPDVVWDGSIGSIPLRVAVPHAGRIIAEWQSPHGARQKVSNSVDQFERAVLFQLMLAAGDTDVAVANEVLDAVRKAEGERPDPSAHEPPRQRRKEKPRHHRRSRRPPRR